MASGVFRGSMSQAMKAKLQQNQAAAEKELKEAQDTVRQLRGQLDGNSNDLHSTRARLAQVELEAESRARQVEEARAAAGEAENRAKVAVDAARHELLARGAEVQRLQAQLAAAQAEKEAARLRAEEVEMQKNSLAANEEKLRADLERVESMKVKMESLSQAREEELQQQVEDVRAQLEAMRLGQCSKKSASSWQPACSSSSNPVPVHDEAEIDRWDATKVTSSHLEELADGVEDAAARSKNRQRSKSRNRSLSRRGRRFAPLAAMMKLAPGQRRRRSRRRSKGRQSQGEADAEGEAEAEEEASGAVSNERVEEPCVE